MIPVEATKALLEEAKELLSKLLGPAAEEAGMILGDNMRVYRAQREVKLLRKMLRILKEQGVSPATVKMNVLFPLLQNAVLEEDEEMGDRWASLLASAADPGNKSNLEAAFVEILKQLAPEHAFLLDAFYDQILRSEISKEEWAESGVGIKYMRSMLGAKISQFDVALDNLMRLRLVAFPTPKLGIANGVDVRFQVTSSNVLCATSLGHAFYAACGKGRIRYTTYSFPTDSVSNVYSTKEAGSIDLWAKQAEAEWIKKHGKDGTQGWSRSKK